MRIKSPSENTLNYSPLRIAKDKQLEKLLEKLSINGYDVINLFVLIDNLRDILTDIQIIILVEKMKGYTYSEISKRLKKQKIKISPSKITQELKKIRKKAGLIIDK